MDLVSSLDLFVNTISLFALAVSLYVFFSDTIRRWIFLGFKPTAIIIIFDSKSDRVLLVNKPLVHSSKTDYPWFFPQGGIYSSDLNNVVNTVLEREFSQTPSSFDFHRVVTLGTKITRRRVESKQFYGSVSIFSNLRGKGYLACIVETDIDKFAKKSKLGFGLKQVKIASFDKALTMIDPVKAKMLNAHKALIRHID